MKRFYFFAFFLFSAKIVLAQNTDKQVVGNYYMQGAHEMASEFSLNADHSFQYFFSYGALDRSGEGTWAIMGDSVVLNSKPNTETDFILVKSQKRNTKGTTIKITSPNAYFSENVYAKIISDKYSDLQKTDNNGLIFFNGKSVEYINLMLQFCPEKNVKFKIKDKSHNYFEFNMLKSILDIEFNNFKFKISKNKLAGKLNFLDKKEYNFLKEK